MWRKLGYVALTYYSPKRLVLASFFGFFVALDICLIAPGTIGSDEPYRNLSLLMFPCILFAGTIAAQLKWQFAHPRSHLTPHFAFPHVGVAFLLLLLTCGLLPLLIAKNAQFDPIGATAFVALGTAAVARLNIGYYWIFPLLVLFYSTIMGWGATFWAAPESDFWLPRLLILVGGWLLTVGGLRAFPRLCEEMPAYRINSSTSYAETSRSERAEQRRFAAEVIGNSGWRAWCSDKWLSKLETSKDSRRLNRVSLLRYGSNALPAPATAMILLLSISGVFIVWWLFSIGDNEFGVANAPLTLAIAALAPAAYGLSQLASRMPRMASEIILPLTRRQYVDGILLCAACDVLIAWFTLHLAIVFWNAGHTAAGMATYLFLTLALQGMLFGAGIRLMLCHSCLILIVAALPLGFFSLAVMVVWGEMKQSAAMYPFIICGLIAAVIGTLCIQSARHAWRELEVK